MTITVVDGIVATTDETGAVFNGGTITNSTITNSPISGSTGSFTTVSAASFFPTSTSGIIGTITNNNAAAGSVGEFVSSTISFGSAVNLTSGQTDAVTSISLTAGDWDVHGQVCFISNAATTMTLLEGGINTVSSAMPQPSATTARVRIDGVITTGSDNNLGYMQVRQSLSATTTVYLVANSVFAVNTNAAFGFIGARRVR